MPSTPLIEAYRGVFPSIADNAFIATNAAIIGDVEIGQHSSVWYGCVVRGDVNEIRIGADTNIQDLSMIHCAELGQGTYLGDRVTVGHSAVLHACTVGNDSMIGIQACVMDDCEVEDNAIVAAGALLPPGKRVPTGEVWAGRPAKKLRDISEADVSFMKINTERYIRLAKEFRSR